MQECLGAHAFELANEEVAAITAAGASQPRRFFWLNTQGQFSENPAEEEDNEVSEPLRFFFSGSSLEEEDSKVARE
jgi:hypothetical protein